MSLGLIGGPGSLLQEVIGAQWGSVVLIGVSGSQYSIYIHSIINYYYSKWLFKTLRTLHK